MRRYIFYPVLLSLYPVLYLYGSNFGEVPFSVAIWPLGLALGAGLLIYVAASLGFSNMQKGALFTFIALLLFYSYGRIHAFIYSFIMKNDIDVGGFRDTIFLFKIILFGVLLFAWITLIIYSILKIRKIEKDILSKISFLLNFISIILVLMPLLTMVLYKPAKKILTSEIAYSDKNGAKKDLGYKPDIYQIVLDGYARDDTHRQYYNFDNSDFLGFLENKGFSTSSNATSNYFWTYLSFASSRNLTYLDDLYQPVEEKPKDRSLSYLMVRDNFVSKFLKKQGYNIIHLNSTWGATMTNPYADEEILCSSGIYQTEFYRVLYSTTMLKMWETHIDKDLADCHLANFKTLENIATTKSPKYVFVHFVPPHHPYLFDKDGNVLRKATVSNQFEYQKLLWSKFDKYIDQTIYVNMRMKVIVEAILEKSQNPPIILLHSDHGPQLKSDNITPKEFIQNRLSIFHTAYTPGSKTIFPDKMSLVNQYSYLLNYYFDANFDVLEDKNYVSHFTRPYTFSRVPFPLKENMVRPKNKKEPLTDP